MLKSSCMDKLDQIKSPIQKEFDEFKELYNSALFSNNPLLKEVLGYIKKRNGKMMRPTLIFLIAKLLDKVELSTYHAALSLELLHTASLIHDDVVDESDKRRGQSSVNAIYNNKVSVLVGDYMLATSLQHSSMTNNIEIVKLVALLGQHLSEGEIVQLSSINNDLFSVDTYYEIIKKKTAALFMASAVIAGLSVNADESTLEKLKLFGQYIGIAFQIKDDIFDYFPSSIIGKPTGNDMLEGKLTLPALYVLNKFQNDEMTSIAKRIRSHLASKEEIEYFIAYIKEMGGIAYAKDVMHDFCSKAFELLPEDIEKKDLTDSLRLYVSYVIEREK